PRSVPKIIHTLKTECGVPSERLEWHGHNDFHLVIANAVAAWLYGCSSANGTILGFGERTGNPPIEGLIFSFIGLKGETFGIDTTVITEIARYYEEVIGDRIPENYPFVGRNFNVTRAGIHADGILKNEEIYNIFDTAKILNRPLGVSITDKSGLAGIAHWISSNFKTKVDKRHPGVMKIFEWVSREYEEGRTTSISDREMMELVRRYLPELFEE
ncbi:TPA: histone-lysine N-methyltransferase, partial [Candidatus Poribacteria bacterium]|nr:histone-lysine N-methyltransferase [Candidatus Poribacteria bacterium]HEX30012.1 histone-lysine N-methyltransferase [Candidatus Poribacteria bacterium]